MKDKPEYRMMATNAIHAGYESPIGIDSNHFRSMPPPLIVSSVFPFRDLEHCASVVQHEEPGFYYSRCNNPTVDILEKRLAAMQGGERAVATPSGMQAIFQLVTHLTTPGDELVSSHMTYGGAYDLFNRWAPKHLGVTTRYVDQLGNMEEWENSITPKTRFLYCETPTNPTLFCADIAKLAKIAHRHNIPLIVDNTLATPYLLNPFEFGADIVVLSLSKFICGNGTVIAGAIVGKDDLLEDLLRKTLIITGSILSPFDAWQLLLSLETLPQRMQTHSNNAVGVTAFLEAHPKIGTVFYPTASDYPQKKLAKSLMPNGYSGMISFRMKGGREAISAFMRALKLFVIGPSFGISRSIAAHAATATHFYMTEEQRQLAGVTDDLVRLSIGLENIDDIIADLDYALSKA